MRVGKNLVTAFNCDKPNPAPANKPACVNTRPIPVSARLTSLLVKSKIEPTNSLLIISFANFCKVAERLVDFASLKYLLRIASS